MTQRTDLPIVVAEGSLDLHSSRGLATRLSELAGSPGEDAVLDLTDVSFIDSIGLGVVLKAASRFQRQGKRLVLVAPDGPARRLLEFAGATERLPVVDDREQALALAERED